jgi:hypothetical protein
MSVLTKRKHIKTPGANGQTAWNRTVRNVHGAMADHLGGADMITTPESLIVRRISVFEAEMQLLEAKIAVARQHKQEVDEKTIDLYSRLTNAQRRLLETVGMKRIPRDVTPTLSNYLKAKESEA